MSVLVHKGISLDGLVEYAGQHLGARIDAEVAVTLGHGKGLVAKAVGNRQQWRAALGEPAGVRVAQGMETGIFDPSVGKRVLPSFFKAVGFARVTAAKNEVIRLATAFDSAEFFYNLWE